MSISWLKAKILTAQAKVKLASRILNKDYPPRRFGILYAEASGLNLD
jgi:hypothetical protein